MTDIRVGVQVLEYAERVSAIMEKLVDASESAKVAAEKFAGDEGFYDGKARAEMKQFYESYAANVDKLALLETMAAQFLGKVFDDFKYTDEDLARVLVMWLG